MRKRILLVLALVGAMTLAPASVAHAQCGPLPPLEESLTAADVVFVGWVVDRSNADRTAIMEVLEVWKGPAQPTRVTVNGGPEDLAQQTAIDRTFLLGQIYLVIPANRQAPFQDSLCSATRLWSTPTGLIPAELQDALGTAVPIALLDDQSPETGGGWFTGLGNMGTALIVLALALILIYRFRRLSVRQPSQNGQSERGERKGPTPSALPAFRRKRMRVSRKLAMSDLLGGGSRGGSGLDKVRRRAGVFRKAPGEHEKELLKRAVKLTATKPPSRRNHYTSGRLHRESEENVVGAAEGADT